MNFNGWLKIPFKTQARGYDSSGGLPLTIDNFGPHDEVLFARPSHFGVGRSSCNHHFVVTRWGIPKPVFFRRDFN
jgi:hypothetical protein